MYASLQLAPGFLTAAAAAPAVLQALQQGGLANNPALTESLRSFDLDRASGLSSVCTPEEIGLLQRLKDGRLETPDLESTNASLQRLELAGTAVQYHYLQGRPGKVGVSLTKPMRGLHHLKKAYSPGVAYASRLIDSDVKYQALMTGVMNKVKIVSDGSAVLGEGALGPYAFDPVGEGKAALMLLFAGLDAYSEPLEIAGFSEVYPKEGGPDPDPAFVERYIQDFVQTVLRMRPGAGAFNVEDVANKTCFWILDLLQAQLKRLVWHDDQQGTAMVTVASLLVALRIQGKDTPQAVRNLRIGIAGAGAAGIVCGRLIRKVLKRIAPDFRDDQIFMSDSKGLLTTDRKNLTSEKRQFAVEPGRTFNELLVDADIFLGVSPKDTYKLSQDQVRKMREKPIILALANPNPEIMPEQVDEARSDAVVFTGRSDRKNQANNSNAFPGTLAGGLDVGATVTTDNMALAGAIAMAEIAYEPVLPEVQGLYPYELIAGSRDYAVASAFDPRVHFRVAEAVAREAVRSGHAAFPFNSDDSLPYAQWFLEQRLQHAFIVPSGPQVLLKMGPSLFSHLLGPEG